MRSTWFGVFVLGMLALSSCSRPTAAEGQSPQLSAVSIGSTSAGSTTSLSAAPVAPPISVVSDPPREQPALPASLRLRHPVEMQVPGDRPLRISHAGPDTTHAIIYLHGMCGNSKGADPWSELATRYGTLIVVRANEPCLDRPGYKWPKDLHAIQERIDQALLAVRDLRNGVLDIDHPTLIGYSQGAYRAEQLIGQFEGRYPRAILGGPPTPPSYEALKTALAVAVLGGELEDHQHMLEGTADLIARGLHAKFFLLPGVHHGSYGPQGPQIVEQALSFVFEGRRP